MLTKLTAFGILIKTPDPESIHHSANSVKLKIYDTHSNSFYKPFISCYDPES